MSDPKEKDQNAARVAPLTAGDDGQDLSRRSQRAEVTAAERTESQHFHNGDCYAMGPGDLETLICKWRAEGGMFGRKEAADELATVAKKKWRL
jgi:hypothetical protein